MKRGWRRSWPMRGARSRRCAPPLKGAGLPWARPAGPTCWSCKNWRRRSYEHGSRRPVGAPAMPCETQWLNTGCGLSVGCTLLTQLASVPLHNNRSATYISGHAAVLPQQYGI